MLVVRITFVRNKSDIVSIPVCFAYNYVIVAKCHVHWTSCFGLHVRLLVVFVFFFFSICILVFQCNVNFCYVK